VREMRVNSAVSFREDVLDLGDGGVVQVQAILVFSTSSIKQKKKRCVVLLNSSHPAVCGP
jgi:hypothetical protein